VPPQTIERGHGDPARRFKMEFMYAKPIQRHVEKQEPATEKQIRLLEIIASVSLL